MGIVVEGGKCKEKGVVSSRDRGRKRMQGMDKSRDKA